MSARGYSCARLAEWQRPYQGLAYYVSPLWQGGTSKIWESELSSNWRQMVIVPQLVQPWYYSSFINVLAYSEILDSCIFPGSPNRIWTEDIRNQGTIEQIFTKYKTFKQQELVHGDQSAMIMFNPEAKPSYRVVFLTGPCKIFLSASR